MAKRKKKVRDRIGKPGEAEAFDRGAQSGGPSLSEAFRGIMGAFDSPDENRTKKKLRKARRR